MKLLTAIILTVLTVSCYADKNSKQGCDYTKASLKLTTPKAENIAQTYWQTDREDYESIDRLFVVYKTGAMAVFEHKYCSMYNFEVAYYSRDGSELSDLPSFEKTLRTLFSVASFSDAKIQESIPAMMKQISENKFDSSEISSASYDGSTEDAKRAEFSISYLPVEDSSLHRAALFVYMGIGGEH